MLYEGYKFTVNHKDGDDYLTLFDHRNDTNYSDVYNGHYDLEDLSIILDKLILKANKRYQAPPILGDDIPF